MSGVKYRYIAGLGAVMIAANLICETLLSFINTVDIVDFVYRLVGVVLVYIYFCCAERSGQKQLNCQSG
jgi:hypothetical protein